MESGRPSDFPSIYRDFVQMFPDVSACAAYLERLRWPNGFVCPACEQQSEPWRAKRERLVCPSCRHQCTVTAGTIFDKTRTPLTAWFDAAWHITTAKNGMSAKTLERMMGISYHPAHVAMPGVHRIASLLWRWLLGTHQGAFSMEHLQSYLEEFTFRFNRRTSSSRGQLFRRLLEQAVATKRERFSAGIRNFYFDILFALSQV